MLCHDKTLKLGISPYSYINTLSNVLELSHAMVRVR
jgi:hypothetical protein